MRACLLLCLTLAGPVLAQSDDDAPPEEAPKKAPKPALAPAENAQDPDAAPDAAPAKPARAKKAAPPEADEAKTPDPTAKAEHPSGAAPGSGTPASSGTPSATPEKQLAMRAAAQFFRAILDSDPRGAMAFIAVPFALEDKRINTPDELFSEWVKNLRQKRTDLLTLYGIELYTPQEMEKKYGKPPPRLAQFPYRDGHTLVAVANISGHGAVALVRLTERGYRVFGYHD